jgi:hypothetical protein
VLLLAAFALLAAGCGGDDSDSSAPGDDTAAVETEATDAADDMSTADDGTASLEGECANFAGLSAKLSSAFAGTNGVDSAAEVFDEIADQVPEEIRDDYEVLADNFQELADALKGIDFAAGETPSPEALAKLQELSSKLNTPEVKQATENIEAWARENC